MIPSRQLVAHVHISATLRATACVWPGGADASYGIEGGGGEFSVTNREHKPLDRVTFCVTSASGIVAYHKHF